RLLARIAAENGRELPCTERVLGGVPRLRLPQLGSNQSLAAMHEALLYFDVSTKQRWFAVDLQSGQYARLVVKRCGPFDSQCFSLVGYDEYQSDLPVAKDVPEPERQSIPRTVRNEQIAGGVYLYESARVSLRRHIDVPVRIDGRNEHQ